MFYCVFLRIQRRSQAITWDVATSSRPFLIRYAYRRSQAITWDVGTSSAERLAALYGPARPLCFVAAVFLAKMKCCCFFKKIKKINFECFKNQKGIFIFIFVFKSLKKGFFVVVLLAERRRANRSRRPMIPSVSC